MPPSPTIHFARQFGEILDLSEGNDASTVSNPAPDADIKLTPLFDAVQSHVLSTAKRFYPKSEIGALYLPSLFRNYFKLSNEVADRPLLLTWTVLLCREANTPGGYRFIRENPAEALNFEAELLSSIVLWTDTSDTVPLNDRSVFVTFVSTLVRLHFLVCLAAVTTEDKASEGPYRDRLTPSMRTELQRIFPKLDALQPEVDEKDKVAYADSLLTLRSAVFPNGQERLEGKELFDFAQRRDQYICWWICEAKNGRTGLQGAERPCDEVPRDELRTCSRCLSVRYCSERHQKLHWKAHKPFCVAPTW